MKSRRTRVALALLVMACGWLLAQPFRRAPTVDDQDASTSTEAALAPAGVGAQLVHLSESPPPPPLDSQPAESQSPAFQTPDTSPLNLSSAKTAKTTPPPIPVAREYSPAEVRKPKGRVRRHRVVDGDTLAMLALRYLGSRDRADELFDANRGVLDDPQVLPIDEWLQIPPRDPGPSSKRATAPAAARAVSTPARNSTQDPWLLKPPLKKPNETSVESPDDGPPQGPAVDPQSPWRRVPPQRRLSAQGSS